MEPDAHWRRVEDVYHRALQCEPSARSAFVAAETGGDVRLAADVESLLHTHALDDGFLETPALESAAAWLDDDAGEPGLDRVGHYRVIELLGAGGMGDVYRAWDEVLERDVALKILRPDGDSLRAAARLRQEGQSAARLSHPNICTVHEVGEQGGKSYLVMELVQGRTLADVLAEAPLTAAQTCRFGAQIAAALAHAHERGVLHRDLKPTNVIVSGDHVTVVDFGIARRLDRPRLDALTRAGAQQAETLAGTVAYMAPELLRGRHTDARTDIWALGILLHECVSGTLPFTGDTDFELASAILERDAPPLPADTPLQLKAIVTRCLAKNPGERFGTAAEVRDALTAAQAAFDSEQPVRRLPRDRSSSPRGAHSRALWIGLAIGLVSVLGLSVWMVRQRDGAGTSTPVLVVLPFEFDGVTEGKHVSVGLADRIVTKLGNVGSLRVRPMGPVNEHPGTTEPSVVARQLGATHVLRVRLRSSAERYEATLELSSADGRPVWEEPVRIEGSTEMELETPIAMRVAHTLKVAVDANERARLERRSTPNRMAFEEYLRGRTALVGQRGPDVDAAIAAFEGSLSHDPNFPDAQAGLAMALVRRPWFASSPEESARRQEAATKAAEQALRLDSSLAAGHEAMAAVYRYQEFEWDKVIKESVRALELSPSLEFPYYALSTAFYHLGFFDLADAAAKAGQAANPRTWREASRNLGRTALFAQRFETAAKELRRAEPFSDDGTRWMLGEAWFYLSEHAKSTELLESVERSTQYVIANRATASLAMMLAARGQPDAARQRLQSLLTNPSPDHHVSHRIGTAYAQLGETEPAVEWLRKATHTGFPCTACLEKDPMLEPLRQSPTFEALLAELRRSTRLYRAEYEHLVKDLF